MKANLPFTYEAEFFKKRSNKVHKDVFIETLDFDLREMKAAEAPVALSLRHHAGAPTKEYRFHNGTFLECVRQDGGLIFTPDDLTPRDGYPAPRQQIMVGYLARGGHAALVDPLKAWFEDPGYVNDYGPDRSQVAEILSSKRDEALGRLRRFADGMALIDGQVWFPVAEPKIAFEHSAHTATVVPFDCNYRDYGSMWGNPIKSPVFNVNALDDAIAYAQRFERITWIYDPAMIDIALPEAFNFDVARHTLEWAAEAAIDAIARDIRSTPDHVVEKWLEARKLVMYGNAIPGGEDRMAELTEELMHCVRSATVARDIDAMMRLWSETDISVAVAPSLPRP
jgi:hypothetical protein